MSNIEELRRLAETALIDGNRLNAMSLSEFKQCQVDKRAYPKATNPAVIKSLIARLEAAQAELAAIRALEPVAWINQAGDYVELSSASTVYGSHTIPLVALPEQKK